MFFPTIQLLNSSADVYSATITYSDINLKFSKEPKEILYDIDAVIQAYLVLLSCRKRKRWWRPEWGTYRLEDLLFEPFDTETADAIAETIRTSIEISANGNTRLEFSAEGISVVPDANTSTYIVEFTLTVPSLDQSKLVRIGLKRPV